MANRPSYDALEKRVRELEEADYQRSRYINELQRFQGIISSSPEGIAFLDKEYRYVIVNDTYERFSRVNRQEFIGLTVAEYLGEEVFRESIKGNFDRCLQGEIINYQNWFVYPDLGRKYMDVTYFPYRENDGQITGIIAIVRDITEQFYVDREREMTLSLLKTLHEQTDMRGLAREVITLMQEWSGCEAVGIRLQQEEDFPYFETKGFPQRFLSAEKKLCSLDEKGEIIRSEQGKPLLECMCGIVIHGRFQSDSAYFTEGGSFWTNSTTALLDSLGDLDLEVPLRGHCHAEGYESVALVPLVAGGQRIGLLQFNDSNGNKFAEQQIALYERLASQLTIGFLQQITARDLQGSEEKYRSLINNLPGIAYQFVLTADGKRKFTFIGEGGEDLFGVATSEIVADAATLFHRIPAADAAKVEQAIDLSARTLATYEIEHRLLDSDNEVRWIYAVSTPKKLSNGAIVWDGIGLDITKRREAEEQVLTSYQDIKIREQIANLFLTSSRKNLYNDILELLLRRFGAVHGYFGYIDKNGDLVCPSMRWDAWDASHISEEGIIFPREKWLGIWGESLIRKVTKWSNQPVETPNGHVRIDNLLIVPLQAEGKLVGQIILANNSLGFSEVDQRQLESFAEFIAPVLKIHLEKERMDKELRASVHKLKQTNIALNVMVDNRQEEKVELSRKLQENFDRLVFPYFESVTQSHTREELLTMLEIIRQNTRTSLLSLEMPVSTEYLQLSPKEVQVAHYIKAGNSSKEIASLLHISPRSVFFHRNNIRKKLGIHKAKTNLQTYLQQLNF